MGLFISGGALGASVGGFVLAMLFLVPFSTAEAQVHRATRLGDPQHRFEEPLRTPQDLRNLLTNDALRADVAEILRQAGWGGNIDDLRRAAASAEIVEWPLAPGTYMPFMSSRNGGKPVALINVVWAGAEPTEAFAFEFASNGWRYRAVAPKACANFYVEFVGFVKPNPGMALDLRLPEMVSLCDPIAGECTVKNTGDVALTGVQVVQLLPEGLRASDGRNAVEFRVGDLAPGAEQRLNIELRASGAGRFTTQARASSMQQVQANSSAAVTVAAPTLALSCEAADSVRLGQPIEVCLVATNEGPAPAEGVRLALRIPSHAIVASSTRDSQPLPAGVAWENVRLAPGATKKFCATVTTSQAGPVNFSFEGAGACVDAASSSCVSVVQGIAALLLEVVDLEDPVEVGSELTYEIRVANQGSAPGTDVQVVCQMEEAQEFVSGDGATAVTVADGEVRLGPVPVLDPGGEASWRIVVRAREPADVRFSVRMQSEQMTRSVDETEATRQY